MSLWLHRRAVTALEYGLIAALVAVAIIPAVKLIAPQINLTFGKLSTAMH